MEFTKKNFLNIKKENVPLFLQSSSLFRNFEEIDEYVSVPSKLFCKEISINSKFDLINTLEILRYWMVDKTPWDIYKFIIKEQINDYSDIIKEFHDLFIIEEIKIILKYIECNKSPYCSLDLGFFVSKSQYGSANLFEYALFHSLAIDEDTCCHACDSGNLEVLKFCNERGFKHQPLEYVRASKNGNHECLQFLFDKKVPYPSKYDKYDDVLLENDPYTVAAENGHIECLKCLHKNKAPRHDDNDEYGKYIITSGVALAICNGHLECLKFLMENGWEKIDGLINYTINKSTLSEEVRLEIIKYLHSIGCEFINITGITNSCTLAVNYGLFDCLKFIHTNGCELNTETACIACKFGNLKCLKYIHENGIQLSNEMLKLSIINGNLDCLKYCHENGVKLENQHCLIAAEKGRLNCLEYCHQNGCKINEDILDKALQNEHFDCVEYALNNGAKGPDNIDVLMKKYIISKNTVLKEFEDTREDLPEKFKDKMDELIADMDNIW